MFSLVDIIIHGIREARKEPAEDRAAYEAHRAWLQHQQGDRPPYRPEIAWLIQPTSSLGDSLVSSVVSLGLGIWRDGVLRIDSEAEIDRADDALGGDCRVLYV